MTEPTQPATTSRKLADLPRSILDIGRDELRQLLADEPKFRADQVWDGLHQGKTVEQLSNVPVTLRSTLADSYPAALSLTVAQTSSNHDTTKWLFTLPGGAQIETVLMHYDKRATVCVSSQAGCAMACSFCATGQAGFERHLSTGEILEQVMFAKRAAEPQRLSNVVFMGMGEPLANLDRLSDAIDRIIIDVGIGARRITVSTVGIIPAMLRFAERDWQVGLAVSLHAARDELRTELVPINSRYPIADLIDACREVRDKTGRRVSYEWAMIDSVNDTDRDAAELADVARRTDAHVNLIPLNPTPGYPVLGTPPARIKSFVRTLEAAGVNVTVRANRGTDIDAACGQLSNREAQPADS